MPIKLKKIINENLTGNYWYQKMNPTVDLVILKKFEDYKILLIKRGGEVEHGKWALPGGFVDTDAKRGEIWKAGKESDEDAAVRELHEETKLNVKLLKHKLVDIGIFVGNNRDPRDTKYSWARAHAFGLILPENYDTSMMKGSDDADDAKWFDINKLPVNLAFDHSKIIKDGLIKLLRTKND